MHAAGGTRARQLAPQHGGEGEADKIIERAARKVGIDQRGIDLARVCHGLGHRLFGDRVENDALDLVVLERLLLFQHFKNVPGDGFAFAIGVGRENELVGTLHGLGDVVESLLGLLIHFPNHLEIMIRIDRAIRSAT